MKKYILYGAGETGKKAIEKYGKDNIAYFCDNNKAGFEIEGIPVINLIELNEIHHDYTVVVTPERWNCLGQICDSLEQLGIRYEHFADPRHLLHIFGTYPEVQYEYVADENDILTFRRKKTEKMYRKMFDTFSDDFKNKTIDLWIYYGDMIDLAMTAAELRGVERIGAYSTSYAYEGQVIPIPDYRSCYDESEYDYPETQTACKESAAKDYECDKAFWIGTVPTDPGRQALYRLGIKCPDKLEVLDCSNKNKPAFVPMLEQSKYKYLLDLRGLGWSDRTKILIQLGRPILMIDRPYTEFFTPYLKPMVHYVPIKEDLSDLLEKIEMLDNDMELYNKIKDNAAKFVEEHLSPVAILEYVKESTLKYFCK